MAHAGDDAVSTVAVGGTEASTGPSATADIGWRDFFVDPRLQEVIARALANNRDLRVAVLNVERARALYRIERADRVPSVGATAAMVRTGGDAPTTDLFTASVGVTEFELDLFGRVRNLSQAALQQYFAQEESRRSAQLALIAEVASAYLALAADREQVRVVQLTLTTREEFHALTQKRYEFGAVSALDLSQSRTQVETARADVARFSGQAARTANALQSAGRRAGRSRPAAAVFRRPGHGPRAPARGLPSEVLLRRPDVLRRRAPAARRQCEHRRSTRGFLSVDHADGLRRHRERRIVGPVRRGPSVWSFAPAGQPADLRGRPPAGESRRRHAPTATSRWRSTSRPSRLAFATWRTRSR